MSSGKQESEKNIPITLEAVQKIEEMKREFGKEIVKEAEKIAEERGVDPNSKNPIIKSEDIDKALEKIKNKEQSNK
jgi:histone H3/H4